jgi:glycosyltransferase involved in cell wall biosynthesis
VRIGLNLVPLRPGQMGGAELYFRDLLVELLNRGEHDYVLVTAPYNHATLPADHPRARRVCLGGADGHARGALGRPAGVLARATPLAARLRAAWQRRRARTLADVIARERIDLWFCPFTDLQPRSPGVPSVITVYDLQHERHPEFFDATELGHRREFYPASCRGADHVVAISEFTRRSVIEAYGVAPERVTAVWLAAAADVDWAGGVRDVERVRAAYGLPARYVFYPANTWRHKNHARLVEALALYRAAHADDLALVLTGVEKEGQPALDAAAARAGLGAALRTLGHVPRADLPGLYAGAACLVFPSLFEGFGIPLVEAMLAGCPIVAADATSIPEVAGDAARLFDPLDPADAARALADVVGRPDRARELVDRGRRRARLFSRGATATRTLEVFARARGRRLEPA